MKYTKITIAAILTLSVVTLVVSSCGRDEVVVGPAQPQVTHERSIVASAGETVATLAAGSGHWSAATLAMDDERWRLDVAKGGSIKWSSASGQPIPLQFSPDDKWLLFTAAEIADGISHLSLFVLDLTSLIPRQLTNKDGKLDQLPMPTPSLVTWTDRVVKYKAGKAQIEIDLVTGIVNQR